MGADGVETAGEPDEQGVGKSRVGSSSWVWLTPLEASVLLREGQSQPGRGQDTSPRPQVLHRTAGDAELREALTQHP